jgi:hypothetical protein
MERAIPNSYTPVFIEGHRYRWIGPTQESDPFWEMPNSSAEMREVRDGRIIQCIAVGAAHRTGPQAPRPDRATSFDQIEGNWHWDHLLRYFEDLGSDPNYISLQEKLKKLKKGAHIRVFGMDANVVIPPNKRSDTCTIILKKSLQVVRTSSIQEVLDA